MEKFEGIQEGPLNLTRGERDGDIVIEFTGKSILRDPSEFLQPILFQVLEEAGEGGRRLVLDFRGLTYMNSSTFTPLIKLLERARTGDSKITVIFGSDQKWQAVSFAALTIFTTSDGRVAIEGQG